MPDLPSSSKSRLNRFFEPQRPAFYASCGVAVLLVVLAAQADDFAQNILRIPQSGPVFRLARFCSKAGEGWVLAAVGILVPMALLFKRAAQAAQTVFLICLTGLLTGAAGTIIRSLAGRTRPSSHEVQGFYGVWHNGHCIIGSYEFASFPSGHTATVAGLAAAVWMLDRRFAPAATVYAVVVAWSRMAMNCHHLSDVVAAMIVGVIGAYWSIRLLEPKVAVINNRIEARWFKN